MHRFCQLLALPCKKECEFDRQCLNPENSQEIRLYEYEFLYIGNHPIDNMFQLRINIEKIYQKKLLPKLWF